MPLISNIYLILLLPLLAAFSCAIIKNKSVNYIIVTVFVAIILAQLFKIAPEFLKGKYIYSNITSQRPSLLLNYNFNIVGGFFGIIIFTQKIISLLFFKSQIDQKTKKTNATFHFSSLVNLFAVLLILTSSNFINLFLSIEIFSISLIATKLSIINKEQKKVILSNILIHNISTIIFVLCLLFLYISIGSFDFIIIKQIISDNKIDSINFAIILTLLIISVSLRFFQFWVCFKNTKIKGSVQQYVSFEDMFTKSIIGLYILLKLSNIFYFNAQIFQELNLDKYLIVLLCISSIYFAISTLSFKNLKLLSIFYGINHIGLIFIAILIGNISSIQSVLYYLFSFSLSCFYVYLISVIIDNYIYSGIVNLRAQKNKGAVLIVNIITISLFILAIFPVSILFFANFYLLKSSLDHPLYFLIIPTILIVSISFFISALNARSDLSRKIIKENILKKVLKRSQINLSFFSYNFYLAIIISLMVLNLILIYRGNKVGEILMEISTFIMVNQI